MPRRTKAASDATAEALLATARRLFTERGYADVGLAEVATATGVSRGAVYHHFTNKAGLFEAVVARVQTEVADAVAAAADSTRDAGGEPWASFEAGCEAFLAASLRPDTRRVMLIDAPAVMGWEAWRRYDAASSGRHLREALVGLDAANEIDVPSVAAATALLSGAMNEAALWAAGQDDPAHAHEQASETLRALLAALRRVGPEE